MAVSQLAVSGAAPSSADSSQSVPLPDLVLVPVRGVERPFRGDRADRPRGGRYLSLRCRPGEQQPVADGEEHVVESFVFLHPAGEVEYALGRLVVGGGREGGAVAE